MHRHRRRRTACNSPACIGLMARTMGNWAMPSPARQAASYATLLLTVTMGRIDTWIVCRDSAS